MRRRGDDTGAAAVEFALVLPLVLLLLGGLSAYAVRAVYGGSAENAARRAVGEARFVQGRTVAAMTPPTCSAALAALPGATRELVSRGTPGTCSTGTLDVCYRPAAMPAGACKGAGDVARPGDRVTARVTVPLPFLSGLFGGFGTALGEVAATAVGQVER